MFAWLFGTPASSGSRAVMVLAAQGQGLVLPPESLHGQMRFLTPCQTCLARMLDSERVCAFQMHCCCSLGVGILAFASPGDVGVVKAQVLQQLLLPMDLAPWPTGQAVQRHPRGRLPSLGWLERLHQMLLPGPDRQLVLPRDFEVACVDSGQGSLKHSQGRVPFS